MVWADTEKNIEIELEGIEKDWSETLINGLSIYRQKNSPRLDSRSVQRLHEQAVDELKHMLTVYGYYSPEITAELKLTWVSQLSFTKLMPLWREMPRMIQHLPKCSTNCR
jgi:translocation and assembly module TamA